MEEIESNREESLNKDNKTSGDTVFWADIATVNFEGYGISRSRLENYKKKEEDSKKENTQSLNKSKRKYKLLIPYALEGEEVLTKVKLKKRNSAICFPPIKILNENPMRVKPICPYFGKCGGCFFEHIAYEKQLELKKNLLKELFFSRDNKSNLGAKDKPTSPDSCDDPLDLDGKPLQIYGAKNQFGYRNRLDLTITNDCGDENNNNAHDNSKSKEEDESGSSNNSDNKNINHNEINTKEESTQKSVAFRERGTYWKTIPIKSCAIALPNINSMIRRLNLFLSSSKSSAYDNRKKEGTMRFFVVRAGENTGDRSLGILLSKNNETKEAITEFKSFCQKEKIENCYVMLTASLSDVSVSTEYIQIKGEGHFTEKVLENMLRVPNTGFFQVNTKGFEELLLKAKEELLLSDERLCKKEAIDLFCGVGTITLSLANLFKKVTGYEIEENSVSMANKNAIDNKINNVEFRQMDLLKKGNLSTVDFSNKILILDPPRAGIGNQLIKKINLEMPKNILYISCNPKSQVQDIKGLKGYKIKSQFAFDIFPQTPHLENVLILERN